MKKIFLVTIILVILAFFAIIPAYAEEYSASGHTTSKTFSDNSSDGESDIIYSDRALDELPPDRIELSDEEKLKLAQDYIAQYGGSEAPENYTVLCFKTLSNGMKLVFIEPKDWEYNEVLVMSPLGKYVYRHGGGRSVKLYQNGVFTEIYDAYINKMIDDAVLEEINDVMHFDRYAEQSATTQPEETTQLAETTAAPETTAGNTTAPQTTKPTQGNAPNSNSSGTNGAIATGDNNTSFAVFISAALAAAAAIGFAALKRKS